MEYFEEWKALRRPPADNKGRRGGDVVRTGQSFWISYLMIWVIGFHLSTLTSLPRILVYS